MGSDIFIDTIIKSILDVSIEGEGFAYLLDKTGTILIHKNKKLLNKKSSINSLLKPSKNAKFLEIKDENNTEKLIAYNSIKQTDWTFVIELDKNTIFEEIESGMIKEIILYLVLLVLILAILYFVLIKILSPLKQLENGLKFFFRYLKAEESNISKLNIQTNDEFGNMAKLIDSEMQEVAKNLDKDRELIENVKKVVSLVQDGKLNKKVEVTTKDYN